MSRIKGVVILMLRHLYNVLGVLAVVAGLIGLALPLVPTVPFMLLAAFFFGRGNPAFERRLLADPRFGPHIVAWREHGAISGWGKICAVAGLTGSAAMGLLFLPAPWAYLPAGVALVCGAWILTRPTKQTL